MLNGNFTRGHGKSRLQSLGFIFPALTENVPKPRTYILNTGILLKSQKLHHLLFPFQNKIFLLTQVTLQCQSSYVSTGITAILSWGSEI